MNYINNLIWFRRLILIALSVSKYIYTIKTQLMSVYIYMFICTELIEETGRPPGLIFGMGDIFDLTRTSSSLGENFSLLTEL